MIDLDNLPDLAALDEDGLLAHLATIRGELDRAEPLRAHRLAVLQEARRREPPVTQRRLAEHAGITEVAVIQALRKARHADEAAAS